MAKLYELTNQYKELELLSGDDAIPAEAIADTLEGIQGEIEAKAENIGKLCANWDGYIDAIDQQLAHLQARKKAIAARKESLKDYLRENMERLEIKKIESPFFTISCVAGRDNAVIDDEELVPDEFFKVIPETKKLEKTAVTKALKEGKEVEGAHLEKTKSSIRIK